MKWASLTTQMGNQIHLHEFPHLSPVPTSLICSSMDHLESAEDTSPGPKHKHSKICDLDSLLPKHPSGERNNPKQRKREECGGLFRFSKFSKSMS
jgi:hypothetical protein